MRRRTRTGIPWIEQALRSDGGYDVVWRRLYPVGWSTYTTLARDVNHSEADKALKEVSRWYETRRGR